MREIVLYIVAIVAMLFLAVVLNAFTNNSKRDRCEKLGGEFIYNSSDANLSMCKLPK